MLASNSHETLEEIDAISTLTLLVDHSILVVPRGCFMVRNVSFTTVLHCAHNTIIEKERVATRSQLRFPCWYELLSNLSFYVPSI